MRKMFVSLGLLALASAAASAPAGKGISGHWRLDLAHSNYGKAAPKSGEVTLTDDGTALAFATKSVGPDGKPNAQSGRDPYGHTVPMKDGSGTRLIRRLGPTAVTRTFLYRNGDSLNDTCRVAGSVMTCAGTRVIHGKRVATKIVYNRIG